MGEIFTANGMAWLGPRYFWLWSHAYAKIWEVGVLWATLQKFKIKAERLGSYLRLASVITIRSMHTPKKSNASSTSRVWMSPSEHAFYLLSAEWHSL
jgi:hypothetical protein